MRLCSARLGDAEDRLHRRARGVDEASAACRGRRPSRRSAASPRRESTAALATAGAIFIIRRGSNGFGIRYSGPKRSVCAAVGRGDDLALLGLRELGDRVHRGDLHLAA